MSRRITSDTVEKRLNSNEAIQPDLDGQLDEILEAVLATLGNQNAKDHQRITVIRETSTKEEKQEDATVLSRVDHRERTLIIYEHLPQRTAKKEVAGGDKATRPSESDQRLEELTKSSTETSRPHVNRFLEEFEKEFGKESAHHFAAFLKWLVLATALFLMFHC